MSAHARGRLFADDCILYRPIKTPEVQFSLQRDLDQLRYSGKRKGAWTFTPRHAVCICDRWQTPFYKQVPVERNHSENRIYQQVPWSGSTITLKWDQHIRKMIKKSNSILGLLKKKLRRGSESTKSNAYKSLVRPNLEYYATIWNQYQRNQINLHMSSESNILFTTENYSFTTLTNICLLRSTKVL